MKNLWQRIADLARRKQQFLRYTFIGAFGAALDFGVFTLLVSTTHVNYLVVNLLSTTLGITTSFFLNLRYTFKVSGKVWPRAVSFYTVGGLGLALKTLILFLLVGELSMNVILAKLCAMVFVLLTQYNLNRLFSFSQENLLEEV